MTEEGSPIPDDFFAPFEQTVATEGFVYHERAVIRAVSLRRLPEYEAAFDCTTFPAAEVLPFLTGEKHTTRWLVLADADDQPRLAPLASLVCTGVVREDVVDVPRGAPQGVFRLKIMPDASRGYVAFSFASDYPLSLPQDGSEEVATFFLTEEGDISSILHTVDIPLRDLVERGCVVTSIPEGSGSFGVLTNIHPGRFSMGVVLPGERGFEHPLPSNSFSDLSRFERIDDDAPCLLLTYHREAGQVSFTLRSGGGIVYERTMPILPILISRSEDPSELLGGFSLPVDRLIDGATVVIDMPEHTRATDVEFHAPLLYSSMRMTTK